MRQVIQRQTWLAAIVPAVLIATVASAQPSFSDTAVIVQFQRAADSYAFAHRQTDRRGTPIEPRSEGQLFTPQVSAIFRAQLHAALRRGCENPPNEGVTFTVPRVNESSSSTDVLSTCLTAALPKLPPELEYRVAGVALVLADAHRHIVVDVMHGVFSGKEFDNPRGRGPGTH